MLWYRCEERKTKTKLETVTITVTNEEPPPLPLRDLNAAELQELAAACVHSLARTRTRKEHKWIREKLLLPIIDEYRTRPEAHRYESSLHVFVRNIGAKPGTVRQWRKRMISPRPSNGRKRPPSNGRDEYAANKRFEVKAAAAITRINSPAFRLGFIDKSGRVNPTFRGSALADGNALCGLLEARTATQ